MKLSSADFKTIVKSTPLVSIDLIVRNIEGNVLLGKRTNRPAQGFWFVPGGRVLKDEHFASAFKRLIKEELGLDNVQSTFKGIYQHFYDDNFSEGDFSTHYLVLAYEISFKGDLASLPLEQHSKYKWFDEKELVESEQVHKHSKWYFQENKQADAPLNK
ncbi:MAG: colanic acid biosynthesis protein WcaH [Alteromonadaceae bacterium]|jgi:colanic acid biosynthesis protein WcaH